MFTANARIFIYAILALAVLATAVSVSYQSYNSAMIYADANDADQVSRGREVYARSCAACHGTNLEGQPDWRRRAVNGRLPAPPHDETGHTWHHPDQLLFEIIKYGVSNIVPGNYQSDMPAHEGELRDDEIWAVIAYIKASWPQQIRQRQQELNNR